MFLKSDSEIKEHILNDIASLKSDFNIIAGEIKKLNEETRNTNKLLRDIQNDLKAYMGHIANVR